MPSDSPAKPEDKRALLRQAALEYHQFPTPGKIAIQPTKQLSNQHDLALAYSPGVAAPCEEIVKDPANAFKYTSRGNLVAVITNGTAVWRHQPRRHQGPRLLLRRAQAARAHEDPGLS